MEKIKKILTDPKLAHYWQELNQEMMGEVPTHYDVTKALKKIGLGKKLMTEYADVYYMMCVICYLGDNEEGSDFEWINKNTLEMKKLYDSEIYSTKQSILYNLNKLLDYRVISENAVEDVKVALDLLDIEDDEDYDY